MDTRDRKTRVSRDNRQLVVYLCRYSDLIYFLLFLGFFFPFFFFVSYILVSIFGGDSFPFPLSAIFTRARTTIDLLGAFYSGVAGDAFEVPNCG